MNGSVRQTAPEEKVLALSRMILDMLGSSYFGLTLSDRPLGSHFQNITLAFVIAAQSRGEIVQIHVCRLQVSCRSRHFRASAKP